MNDLKKIFNHLQLSNEINRDLLDVALKLECNYPKSYNDEKLIEQLKEIRSLVDSLNSYLNHHITELEEKNSS